MDRMEFGQFVLEEYYADEPNPNSQPFVVFRETGRLGLLRVAQFSDSLDVLKFLVEKIERERILCQGAKISKKHREG